MVLHVADPPRGVEVGRESGGRGQWCRGLRKVNLSIMLANFSRHPLDVVKRATKQLPIKLLITFSIDCCTYEVRMRLWTNLRYSFQNYKSKDIQFSYILISVCTSY